MDEDSSTNPYLALRAAKIARNQARLRELGLLSVERPHAAKQKRASRVSESRKKVDSSSHNDTAKPQELRRSKRLKSTAVDNPCNIVSPSDDNDKTVKRHSQARRVSKITRNQAGGFQNFGSLNNDPSRQHAPNMVIPSNSARAIYLDVEVLMQNFLGKQCDRTGKAAVIEESARKSYRKCTLPSTPISISFNKYSGVQEWAGNVLFLWVNLGSPKCDVVNEFLADGRHISWFGGARMHKDTPVIQKLTRVGALGQQGSDGDDGEDKQASNSAAVVLWCREYNAEKRSFLPYVCLGKLSVSATYVLQLEE